MTPRAICLVSGGLDSAVALWWARSRWKFHLETVSFLFKGRPRQEIEASRRLSRVAGSLRHHEIPMPFPPPDGRGYLPKRNLAFYAVAASLAETRGAKLLVGGHLATDGSDFPDAASDFFRRLESLTAPVRIKLPLIGMSKAEAVRFGWRLGCPLHLTWSCYRDRKAPCGVCAACHERLQSFAKE